VVREIMVAARTGGGDVSANPRLRLAIEKAKAANMPADTIKRNVDKATGNLEGVSYEEIRYEGYGIGGAAVIVDTMTDNHVRTVAEVRHAFSKYGGNLGTEGSVAFQFKNCGQLIFAPGTNEDKVMDVALEAGAEDVITDEEGRIERFLEKPAWSEVLTMPICSRAGTGSPPMWSAATGQCGKRVVRWVWKAVSKATMAVTGAFTTETLKLYGLGLPFLLAGLWSGFQLYGQIDDETFRKVVLVLLLLAGLSLIATALIARGA
jgi:hypothetical protein